MLTTTAISYTNGAPHIGHLYELILADFLARQAGTRLLTGTDEHGKKIEQTANANNETPYNFCTRHSKLFQGLADRAQVSYARFIRTTDADHVAFVQDCIRHASKKGDIYLSTYEGWYCVREESFISESDAAATGYKDPVTGVPYEKITEPAYFFRLSAYQEQIIAALDTIQFVPADVLTQFDGRLHALNDLCISRTSFKWGIPFPDDPAHCVYVWFDALLNYITGARSLSTQQFHHVVGKDIVWFHTAIYIGILLSCDLYDTYKPQRITVHDFIVDELGRKMSKSIGNVIDVNDLLTKYPIEAIRFYFLHHTTFTNDIRFSHADLVACYNNILVKQFGNLFQRIVALALPIEATLNAGLANTAIRMTRVSQTPVFQYITDIQEKLSAANGSLQASKPWEVQGADRVELLLPHIVGLLEIMDLLEPVIPEKIRELTAVLGWDGVALHLTRDKKRAFTLLP
jgi:methionyl-tRNA synthetase